MSEMALLGAGVTATAVGLPFVLYWSAKWWTLGVLRAREAFRRDRRKRRQELRDYGATEGPP